jgi:DNA-binding SARP family transcriptional activator
VGSPGEAGAARQCLTEAATASTEPIGGLSVRTALALASVLLTEGDEESAALTLRSALAPGIRSSGGDAEADLDADPGVHPGPGPDGTAGPGPERGPDRRALRHVLSLTYVLVPETRSQWDAAPLRGHLSTARELARAVVATRDEAALTDGRLWRLQLPDLGQVRAALHHRFAAELAVGLARVGRTEGGPLLDALGPVGRAAVQDIARGRTKPAKAAKALLAAVPAPPPVVTQVAVLGPLVVWRETSGAGGAARTEVVDPDLRRSRVRALLAFLVSHRRTRRTAITAALWPDLDDKSAGNNLGVTLNHLLRALEPWRTPGEPPYLVRLDGPTVELMVGAHLRVDVDDFDESLRLAAKAEAEGSPSVALQHHLAATELYRHDLFADVELPEADWIEHARVHHCNRFVASATRAAGLLVGQGDTHRAEALVQRALAADPWNEDAYAVLTSAALGRDDPSAARRTLRQCLEALDELGAPPSPTTVELLHRCGLETAVRPSRRQPA